MCVSYEDLVEEIKKKALRNEASNCCIDKT
jgi:hypothetical protein